jgi:hypothetical protein
MSVDFAKHARAAIRVNGADWTATPAGESPTPFTLRGVLYAAYAEVIGAAVAPGVSISQPRFLTMHADLNGLTVGATLALEGDTYTVAFVPDKPERPAGVAVLELEA